MKELSTFLVVYFSCVTIRWLILVVTIQSCGGHLVLIMAGMDADEMEQNLVISKNYVQL
jgi:predicted deacylase